MLGWRVVDANGRAIGKLTELMVAPRDDYVVVSMVVGPSTPMRARRRSMTEVVVLIGREGAQARARR